MPKGIFAEACAAVLAAARAGAVTERNGTVTIVMPYPGRQRVALSSQGEYDAEL
ncbi:MAG: hypothetical protein K6T94_16790 [Paenibacillus sp.]|nr:hypothetical protein [Paenibacillus sp.]